MKQHFVKYFDFYGVILLWVVVAMISSTAAMGVVALSLMLFWLRKHIFGLVAGFIFLLVLSDSLDVHFAFAKSFKNLYILFLAFMLLSDGDNFRPYNKIFLGFIPFIAVAVVGFMYAGNLSTAAMKTISYLLLVILVPNYLSRLYRENGPTVLADIAYFLVFVNLLGVLMGLYNHDIAYLEGRFRGMFGNPNGQGLFIYLSFAYFFVIDRVYPGIFSKGDKRLVYGLMLLFLYLCGSRTAFISIFILMFFNWVSFLSPYISFLILLVIILSLDNLFIFLVDLIRNLGFEEYFRLRTLDTGSGRFIAWRFAWTQIQDFFFFGGSLGNDEYVMRQHYGELARLGHQGGVHNSYLTLWFDVGIVGLIFYFFNFFRLFFRAAGKHVVSLPLLYSTLFCITYESWLAGSLNPFTIILFMSISVLTFELYEGDEPTEVENEELAVTA